MPSLAGLPDVPCARCGKRGRIEWGTLCPICQGERMEKALRLSRWVSIGAALLAGIYAVLRIGPENRWYSAIAVIAVYLITRRLVTLLAMEFLPRDWEPGKPKENS
jgi:hypothetical protein